MNLGTLLKIIIVILLSSSAAKSQKCYITVFAAKNDNRIGKLSAQTAKTIENRFKNIAMAAQMHPNTIQINSTKFSFNRKGIEQYIRWTQSLQSNDIALFYFIGWGWASNQDSIYTPNLLFSKNLGKIPIDKASQQALLAAFEQSIYNFSEIKNALEASKTQLTIAIVDANNSSFANTKSQLLDISLPTKKELFLRDQISQKRAWELLKGSKGHLTILGGLKGEQTYISQQDGSFFSHSFLSALEEAIQSPKMANWTSQIYTNTVFNLMLLCQDTAIITEQLPDMDGNIETTPQLQQTTIAFNSEQKPFNGFTEFWVNLFHPKDAKIKKLWKTALQKGDLDNFLVLLERDEKVRGQTPALWTASMALLGGLETSDGYNAYLTLEDEYKYVSLLIEMCKGRQANFSKRDEIAERRIIHMVKKYAVKGSPFAKYLYRNGRGNLFLAANTKSQEIKEKLLKMLPDGVTNIEQLYQIYTKKIHPKTAKLSSLKDSIATYQNILKQYKGLNKRLVLEDSIRNNLKINISTNVTQNISAKNKQDLIQYLDCRMTGKTEKDCKSFFSETKILGTSTKLTIESVVDTILSKNKPAQIDDDLSCSTKLKEFSKAYLNSVQNYWSLQRLDSAYKSKLKVKLTVTGYADWKGAGSYLKHKYPISEPIYEYYQDQTGNTHKAVFSGAIQDYKITNQELAFLKAYCVYRVIKTKLKEWGIQVDESSRFITKFIAIEQQKKERGINDDSYRRVVPILEITNLAEVQQEQLQKLEQQTTYSLKAHIITKQKEQIKELKEEIINLKQLQEKLRDKQIQLRKQCAQIVTLIKANEVDGENTQKEIQVTNAAIQKFRKSNTKNR